MSRGGLDPDRLRDALRRHLDPRAEVVDLERLSGGASRETWSFDVVGIDGGRVPLILRRDPTGGGTLDTSTTTRRDEYDLVRAAAAAGVAVPPLRFPLEPDDELGDGFVMDRVAGETLGRRIVESDELSTARTLVAAQCGAILARIHAIPLDAVPLTAPSAGATATDSQLDQFERLLDGFGVARPVLELALRWLRDDAPPPGRVSVVHGDFRVGNLIVGPDGVRAVLDWELAHVGDPVEDIGWLCVRSWRFGGSGRVGGVGDLEDLLDAYHRESGERIDPEDVRYWEVFGNLRWAVICLVQAFQHLRGPRRSVELAAIGRRVCEVEHDLMELLG